MSNRSVQLRGPDNNTPAAVDSFSGHLVVMDSVHAQTHAGRLFGTGVFDVALADAASLDLLIITAASGVNHLRADIVAEGNSVGFLYEGTTVTANGTPIVPVNRNRLSANVASAQFFTAPSLQTLGTELGRGYLVGGDKSKTVGDDSSTFSEWLLAPSTTYMIRLTNISAGPEIASLNVIFYDTSIA